jgi:hypothetical protein
LFTGRRCYDATKPMGSEYDVPIYRLRSLRGLQDCGLIRIGNKDTGKINEYQIRINRVRVTETYLCI